MLASPLRSLPNSGGAGRPSDQAPAILFQVLRPPHTSGLRQEPSGLAGIDQMFEIWRQTMRRFSLIGACLLAATMSSVTALAQPSQTPLMLTFTQPVAPNAVQLVQIGFARRGPIPAPSTVSGAPTAKRRWSAFSRLTACRLRVS